MLVRRALPLVRFLRSSSSEPPRALLNRATALQIKGDIPEAEALAARALDGLTARADRADAHGFLGKLCAVQGRYDDALAHFESARSARDPGSAEFYGDGARVASALEGLGRASAAAAAYRAALDGLVAAEGGWRDGAANHAAVGLGRALAETGDWAGAEAAAAEAAAGLEAALGADDVRTQRAALARALAAAGAGKIPEALALVAAAMESLDPRHPAYREAMAVEADLRTRKGPC